MSDNYQIKDGNGTTLVVSAKDIGGGVLSPKVTVITGGAETSSTNGQPVDAAGLPVSAASLGTGGSGLLGWLTQIALNTATNVLSAGNAIIGRVGIDQSTPGTTNKVSIGTDGAVVLQAGTAKVGQFAIDQTTPGTTNLVQIAAAQVTALTPPTSVGLNAGSALIGKVGIDQTTPGTTNLVQLPASQITALTPPTSVGLTAGTAKVGQFAIDQTTPGTTNLVQLPTSQITTLTPPTSVGLNAGENHLGEVAGRIAIASGTLTRPANTTAYTANTIIGNNVTAGSCAPTSLTVARSNDKSFLIRRLSLKVNDTAWLNAVVRVHLYRDSPTYANGDGAAWISGTSESNYIGYCDVILDRQFSDPYVKGHGVPSVGSEWNCLPSAGTQNIFAVLETRSAVTPGSAKVFSLTAEVHQN